MQYEVPGLVNQVWLPKGKGIKEKNTERTHFRRYRDSGGDQWFNCQIAKGKNCGDGVGGRSLLYFLSPPLSLELFQFRS